MDEIMKEHRRRHFKIDVKVCPELAPGYRRTAQSEMAQSEPEVVGSSTPAEPRAGALPNEPQLPTSSSSAENRIHPLLPVHEQVKIDERRANRNEEEEKAAQQRNAERMKARDDTVYFESLEDIALRLLNAEVSAEEIRRFRFVVICAEILRKV